MGASFVFTSRSRMFAPPSGKSSAERAVEGIFSLTPPPNKDGAHGHPPTP
jgi:hypothetical protein